MPESLNIKRATRERTIWTVVTPVVFIVFLSIPLFLLLSISDGSKPASQPFVEAAIQSQSQDPERWKEEIRSKDRVVVSLSSFPGRLEAMEGTIRSLMSQSYPISRIILTIPWTVKRLQVPENLPSIIKKYEADLKGLLYIHRSEDYGPATKLLGALQLEKDPETVIVILDDDTGYHEHTVLALVESIQRFPDTAPCFVCEYWPWWWYKSRYHVPEGTCKGWLNAYASAAVRVRYFDNKVFNLSGAPEGCFFHDDVWISGNLMERGIRPFLIKPGFESVLWHAAYNSLSIHMVEDGEKRYRNPCIAHFKNFA